MTSNLDIGGESASELHRRRVFRAQIWSGAALLLLPNVALYYWGQTPGPWRWFWAVLPIVPLVWMVIAVTQRVCRMDEYQRKLFFPGLAVGFTVSMVSAIALGTLSSAGFGVPNTGWVIAVLGILSWETTNLIVGAPSA
ncbi:hypothetical protein ACPPVW_04475 [Leifsonia sp. McL0607]|uniref:hypothetical protein n=1 Tax=Leifsonia sp. McL0607 TaxID=3415672 RepID=UPI003CE71ACE